MQNNMTDQFLSNNWGQYILLEREFLQTLQYVNLDAENAKTFSHAYQKLLLGLGSEVDVALKFYCKSITKGFRGATINKYCECITNSKRDFVAQVVKTIHTEQKIQPWINWQSGNSPFWWKAYNAIKHNRPGVEEINGIKQSNYKFANQGYTLQALAGLFQIMVYAYYDIAVAEEKKITTPLPGSKLFRLIGNSWDDINFYGDSAFYVDKQTGQLIYETNPLLY